MNIQYYHATKEKLYAKQYTAAIIVPEKDELLDLLAMSLDEPELKLVLKVGLTKVSPKDQYNRKTGREQAFQKIKKQIVKVKSIDYNQNRITICLTNSEVMLSLQISTAGKKVHLISVEV